MPTKNDDQVETARMTLDEARRVLRADYYQEVASVADDLLQALKNGEVTDREGALDWLHETLDSHRRVIYTAQAMEVVLVSDNDGAYDDNYGAEGIVEDGQIQWSRLAYAAMEADVFDNLRTRDNFDINAEYCDKCKTLHDDCPEADEDEE
jgi:hypothetical protein